MLRYFVSVLVLMLVMQQPAAAQTETRSGPDAACHWLLCLTKEQLITGGLVAAGAAASTVLAASAYAPEQAGELAAKVLLSGMFSAAATLAVVGISAYYYGPQLWEYFGYQVKDKPAAMQAP